MPWTNWAKTSWPNVVVPNQNRAEGRCAGGPDVLEGPGW